MSLFLLLLRSLGLFAAKIVCELYQLDRLTAIAIHEYRLCLVAFVLAWNIDLDRLNKTHLLMDRMLSMISLSFKLISG